MNSNKYIPYISWHRQHERKQIINMSSCHQSISYSVNSSILDNFKLFVNNQRMK